MIGMLVAQVIGGALLPDNAGEIWVNSYSTLRAIVLGVWIGAAGATLFWAFAIRGSELDRAGTPR